MTQDELLKALKGGGGRQQTNFDLGQISLRPTIQRGGQYNVQVQQAPQTNPALQLADALKGGSQLLNQFVDIQKKQGEIEANALSPEEVIKRVEQGDPNAGSFLDKLGKEKTFVEETYKRYFKSTVQPKLTAVAEELKNKPVHEYADQGITTQEDFKVYAEGRVKELTDQFGEYTNKSPYAKVLHNQLIEEIVPDLVQRQVSNFDAGITKFNQDSAKENLLPLNETSGLPLTPASKRDTLFLQKPRGTIYGWEKPTAKTYDPASAKGVGADASPKEQEDILAGRPSAAKLIANKDFALSPDLEDQFKAQGFKMRDTVTLLMEDGTTHTGRWMDRTAKEFEGKTMSGRVDIYSPNADSPLKDKTFAGFSRSAEDAVNKFNEDFNNVISASDQSLANAKIPPAERAQLLRKHVTTEVNTLSTQGKFAEARKIIGALNNLKLGAQPLFGSAEGRANYAALEDLVDREEDQFSALNERTSKTKVENTVAPVLLDLRKAAAQGGDFDDLHKQATDKILQNASLTPAEQEQALRSVDTLMSNQRNAAFTAASQADTGLNKAQEDGGSTYAVRRTADILTDDGAAAFIATNPDIQSAVMQVSADGTKKVINPAFKLVAGNVLSQILPQKSSENYKRTEMIEAGVSFDYVVNGKDTRFEGTQDKNEQKNLHLKLAQALKEDLDNAVSTGIKSEIGKNPVFVKIPAAVDSTRAQLMRQEEQKLMAVGMTEEEAKKTVLQQSIAETKGNTLFGTNGKPRKSNNFLEGDPTYVSRYVNDVSSGLFVDPKEHAEIYNVVKQKGNKVAKTLVSDTLQAKSAPEKLKAYSALNDHFKNVGIPWDSVQKGFMEVDFIERADPSPFGSLRVNPVKKLYSLDSIFNAPNSESTYQIIPLNIMQNLDNPKAKAAVQKIADDRYDGDYNRLVKGQENWYSSKNISLTK